MIRASSLKSDTGRKIAYIEYDLNNNPVRIQFTNANVTKYVYSATGEKLRVIYQTSVYPEDADIVKIGKTKELTPEEINCTETVDYLLGGSLVMKNGKIDKVLFEGGYAQATAANSTTDKFAFNFYNQDHLGNNREVVDAKGNVTQVTNYYPFGAPYADATAVKGANLQPYKYNGKEFDNMHGLNTYDYGARQYNPVTARWDRIDPLCEKYYSTSPYAYCRNNPVIRIDVAGLYDTLHISGQTNYPVIAVFQQEQERDGTLEKDYQAADAASVPMLAVQDINDFDQALTFMQENGITFDGIVFNSHGSRYGGFKIGSTVIDEGKDFKGLEKNKKALKDKTIFIGACDVGINTELVQDIAKETKSTTIAAKYEISAEYQYDGTLIGSGQYSLARRKSPAASVKNLSIDKNKGIRWEWSQKMPTWW